MTWIIIASVFLVLILIWALFLRPWLKRHGYIQGFFSTVEPIERRLYKKSETILYARLNQIGGFLLIVLPAIGAFDPTPYMPFVPEKHRWWVQAVPGVAVSVNGIVCEHLRRTSTKPLDQVAISDQAPPEVKEAIAQADAAKDNASIVIQQAKEEGKPT